MICEVIRIDNDDNGKALMKRSSKAVLLRIRRGHIKTYNSKEQYDHDYNDQ